jgi:hypothetical protein
MAQVLQYLEMMLYHCRGADMAAMENVPDRRRVPLLVYELTDEDQDLLSPWGCLGHIAASNKLMIVQMYY